VPDTAKATEKPIVHDAETNALLAEAKEREASVERRKEEQARREKFEAEEANRATAAREKVRLAAEEDAKKREEKKVKAKEVDIEESVNKKRRISDITEQMAAIERKYGGFGNIPVAATDYWGLRNELQRLSNEL